MNHTLESIADSQFLNLGRLKSFAYNQGLRYLAGDGTISTWDTDAFVAAYKASVDDATLNAERDEIIARIRKENKG